MKESIDFSQKEIMRNGKRYTSYARTVPKVQNNERPIQAFGANDPRIFLRKYICKYRLDPNQIVKACGLNDRSTPEDFMRALEYAQSLTGNQT